ncbi:MAG TPA: I78 family peptidase inhibitor [Luteimonas sp.]|nr:I78 family peptidase inhibitor [Luteimonas sp.]
MTLSSNLAPNRRPAVIASLGTLCALALAACAPKPTTDGAPPADTAPAATEPAPAAADAATPPAAATTPEADAAPGAPDMSAQCSADAAQSFVGKEATDATVADAKAAAGAKGDVRVIKPGQPVTMDFRGDRLNVEVDERNAIVRITCG